MATIKDIANRLGVSVSTVSKGLNGASDISDELRQMVLDTAVEMGYSTKRSKKVENRKLCIFIENMNYETIDEFGYDIVLGFKQNAFRRKWDVDILPITPAFQEEEKYDTFLLKNGYCGAFLMGLALHDSWIKQLENTTMPTVLFDNFISGNPNVCYLGTDSYEGITMAVNHLVNLGHKNIAFLNGSLYSLVSDQRQEAFESAMAAASLPVQKDLTAYGYYVSDSAKYHVPGFLAAGATAVVCGNDLIAKGVIDEFEIIHIQHVDINRIILYVLLDALEVFFGTATVVDAGECVCIDTGILPTTVHIEDAEHISHDGIRSIFQKDLQKTADCGNQGEHSKTHVEFPLKPIACQHSHRGNDDGCRIIAVADDNMYVI